MRNPRFHVLKLLATLAMIASISGLFGLSASAAPGSIDAGARAPSQTAELCHALDLDGDLTLTADELNALDEDLNGDGVVNEVDVEILRSFCSTLPSLTVPGPEVAIVTVSVFDCPDLGSDVSVWGAPGGDCVVSETPVVVTFASQGEGEQTSRDVTVTGSISVPLALNSYTVTEGETFQQMDVDVTAGGEQTLTLLRSEAPAPETFPVTIVADTEDDGSAAGAIVTIEEDLDVQAFMAAQAAPVTGTIGADNTATFDLPAGNYIATIDATAQGYGVTTAAFAVPGEDTVVVDLAPVEPMGFVSVENVYCGDIDAVTLNPTFALDDCEHGAGTFTFYLQGDGTDEYVQLNVWEDGFGFIELAPGTYTMVVEGTGAEFDVVVTAGETTAVVVANPGAAPAPRDGGVNVSAFVCNNIDEVIFSSDSFMRIAALPTHEPACDPGTATLTFYLIGDETDAHWQVVADPTGSITLAPGNYEVVEEGTQARAFVTVPPGDFINLDVQIPAGGEVVPGNSVNIVKFYCDTVTETEFLTYDLADISDRDQLAGAPDCVSGPATFTFYLVGDGTADYAQIWVDGAGTIGLDPGTYEVVEEETQARFTFEVLDGENTLLVVNNPLSQLPSAPEEPVTPEEPGEGETGGVTELPSTGSGHADSNSTYVLAAAAAALLAGAGAFVLRRDEAA